MSGTLLQVDHMVCPRPKSTPFVNKGGFGGGVSRESKWLEVQLLSILSEEIEWPNVAAPGKLVRPTLTTGSIDGWLDNGGGGGGGSR